MILSITLKGKMAKKKTNAKVVSKAKSKAKKTAKRSKTSAKSAAKSAIAKQIKNAAEQSSQNESNLESDLKISKFAKAPASRVVDEEVADDLMTLNQKLNQIFDKQDSEQQSTEEPASESAKPKATRINLEPISAEMIEKSAEINQQTEVSDDDELPVVEDLATEAEAETIAVHVKPKAEVVSDDAPEDLSKTLIDNEWEDELSDDVAEELSDQLDEIDEHKNQTQDDNSSQTEEVISLDDDEPLLGVVVSTEELMSEIGVTRKRRSPRIGLLVSVILVMALAAVFLWRLSMYQWVQINGQQFKNEAEEQIIQTLINQKKDHKISFQIKDQSPIEIKMGDAGVSVDSEKLSTAIRHQRQLSLSNLFFKSDIDLPLMIDYPVLQSVLDDHFKDGLIKPVDAKLTYDRTKNSFVVTPPVTGYRVDARQAITDPSQLIKTNPVIKVSYQAAGPIVQEVDLKPTENYLNERLKLRINLNHNGKILYFADPWDIADWVEMKPDSVTKKITVDFSKQKIQDFIEKTVSPEIARGVVNKKVLVDDKDQVLQVLQQGQRGLGAVNPGDSADKIRQALLDNQNLEHDLNIQEIDFVEERIPINGLKWIEVNLTKQTTTLYSGDKALQTFVISSGVHPWPTPTGTYKVWFKNPIQRMRGGSREAGDYYDLPNVRWNTYFNRDIGFHTAYWHNNFGRPMSHGCINMREADAKVVFDFAPIGTMVVVKR